MKCSAIPCGPAVRLALAGLVTSSLAIFGCDRQEEALEAGLERITPTLVRSHLRFLSHDLLRGRDTGDVGYEIAKEYVAVQFERVGLEPHDGASYLQPFELLEATADLGSRLEIGQLDVREPEARFAPAWLEGETSWEGEGLYVGYGLATHDRDDYEGADVKGKAVFLLAGEPPEWSEDPDRARAAANKAEIAMRKGAALVIELASPPTEDAAEEAATQSAWPRRQLALADGTTPRVRPQVTVGPEASAKLLASWGVDPATARGSADDEGAGQPHPTGSLRVVRKHTIERVQSWNVVGIVRGSDPASRDESIVFTAHLDHVGIGPPDATGDRVANGTHDNGLGSAKILAAAEIMARLRPRRSIVFAAVGAEERGLLGSWYYVRNAALPIEKAVANINVDGGREGVATNDVIANAADVSELYDVVREVMASRGVGVMERDRAARNQVGFSSDHYSFLLAGVPAVDLKPGHTVDGDPETGLGDRLRYYRELRHRPADNFDEDAFTLESAAEMARRSVWLAWHLSETQGMPEINAEHAIWRKRGRPEQPFYFGKRDPFLN